MSEQRLQQLCLWFRQLDKAFEHWQVTPLFADASFRRYFRAKYHNHSYVLLDSPPAQEPLAAFLRIAQDWRQAGIFVPKIHEYNTQSGFVLIEDVGDNHLEMVSPDKKAAAYCAALQQLNVIQQQSLTLPLFSQSAIQAELQLLMQWTSRWIHLALQAGEQKCLQDFFCWLAEQLLAMPQTTMHKDFHCRNLMMVKDEIAVLDFQDAVKGPYIYDLVSLLADAYVSHDKAFFTRIQRLFIAQYPQRNAGQLSTDFSLVMLQRHIKILGIFCRLWLRDNKQQYLASLPRVCGYIDTASSYVVQHYPQWYKAVALIGRFASKSREKVLAMRKR